MRYTLGALALTSIAIGCTGKAGLDVDTTADINLNRPVPVEVNARDGAMPVAVTTTQPINITITGLTVDYTGTFIPEPLFSQINEGDSTEYVAAIFGKPDFESVLGDGSIIWRWKYQPQGQQGPLISLLGGVGGSDEPSPDHVTAIAIFKDGKLLRKWRG